jgi:dTDP-4-dehydrorhamnose reductase
VGPILLIGAGGQLGTDLARVLPALLPARPVLGLARAQLDITDPDAIERVLAAHAPAWVLNTAAFHRVDDIERDPEATRQAFLVNVAAVHHLARACTRHGARLLHLSTDYVFSGGQDGGPAGPYGEEATPAPMSAYGMSKLAGERLLLLAARLDAPTTGHVVVRSSGLYGVAGSAGKGGNFVETMLRMAREGQSIRVVDDQITAPTYTHDLAEGIARLVAANPSSGVYHLSSGGACSWYEFARQIFAFCGLSPRLGPTTSTEFGAPARRPSPNGVLANTRAAALGLPPLRPWPEALEAYLRAKGHLAR